MEDNEMLDDSFFADYAKKMKEEENEKKQSQGDFAPREYEQIGFVGTEKGVNTIVRLVGAPVGAEKMGYKRRPSDPKEIMTAEVKDDEGKRFTIRMPVPTEGEDTFILQRVYKKVNEVTWIPGANGKTRVFVNQQKYPDLFEKVNKGGFVQADGNTYSYSSGYKGNRVSIYNVIDRNDTWCKDNKHTKILARDLNVDDQGRVWAKPGIKSYGTLNKISDIIAKDGNFEKYDLAFKKTGQKEMPYEVKNASKMKSKEMMEELLNDDGSTVNPEKIFVGPLSDEEKNYERYDIDKIYCPTSYRTLLKRIPSVFKLCDACLGTHFFDELSSLAEKEKKEWEAIDAENKAAQDKAENEEIKKNLNMTDAEISEATSPDTPADADVMAEPPKRTRSSPVVDVTSFPPEKIALLKGWQYLSDANKKRIQDITNIDGKVDIVWDRKDDLLRCDTCNAMSPEDATHCPVCGMKF